MDRLSLQQLADQAEVAESFVDRLIEVGALGGPEIGYGERDVRLAQLLHTWEAAGLPAEMVLSAVERGDLSFDFLDTPAWTARVRLDRTYEEIAAAEGISFELIRGMHEAMGFVPPQPDDRAREDDLPMLQLLQAFLDIGAPEAALRLFRIYADNLRRVAIAESDLYRQDIEPDLLRSGMGEAELMRVGAEFGRRITPAVERSLLAIYHRHRQHVWTEHSVNRAETAMEGAGLLQRVVTPPAICFVDLTGYTRLTEEQGDEVAAGLAVRLSSLVEDISRRNEGRPIRWLGDGGMFLFKDPSAAVRAAMEMVENAPAAGLPPTHVGIQVGPVILQDGDVYGSTVNVAARIAALAGAGEVLVSQETVDQATDTAGVAFERVGPMSLKGVTRPVTLYRARRPTAEAE